MDRGWHSFLAQPPAKSRHPFGMTEYRRRMAALKPGGFRAVSRWLRSLAMIPPKHREPVVEERCDEITGTPFVLGGL